MLITVSVTFIYLYMVVTGKAEMEGFVILATYIVKKALDIIEVNGQERKP